MKHYIITKQLITKLSLLFTLLILCSVGAKANDVYYEQCTSLNDIVAGQTYLIVISDGKSHYALRANANNGSAITMESDKKIKNPDAPLFGLPLPDLLQTSSTFRMVLITYIMIMMQKLQL